MGGDTRHFVTLAGDLRSSERFSVELVNTSRARNDEASRAQNDPSLFRNAVIAVRTVVAILAYSPHVDVISFHASTVGCFVLARWSSA